MKKMLTILTTITLCSSIGTQVVGCAPKQVTTLTDKDPLLYGKDVDRSKAIDSSKQTESGYTNFFVVGDSLSDVDGIGNFFEKKLANMIPDLIDLKINFEGNYGFTNNNGIWHAAFSNGEPAAYLLGQKLGFEEMKPSNQFMNIYDDSKAYGHNYSIGGATATKIGEGAMSILDEVTIDAQAKTLLSQHKNSKNDLVILEIGGNDLFALNDLQANPTRQVKLITDGLERLRDAIFSLLNNGIKNVLFLTPPKMDYVSRYIDNSPGKDPIFDPEGNPLKIEEAKYIQDIGNEYQQRLLSLIDEVEKYYPENFETYDLYSNFESLKTEFKKSLSTPSDYNGHEAYSNKNEVFVKLNGKEIEIKPKFELTPTQNTLDYLVEFINGLNLANGKKTKLEVTIKVTRKDEQEKKNIENFFFVDFVHPTKGVHKIVADKLMQLVKN